MKTLKALLVASAIIFSSVAYCGSIKTSFPVFQFKKSGITADEITAYLISTGHQVLSTPVTRDGGITWVAITFMKGHTYLSTVYTEGEYIVECEDSMID